MRDPPRPEAPGRDEPAREPVAAGHRIAVIDLHNDVGVVGQQSRCVRQTIFGQLLAAGVRQPSLSGPEPEFMPKCNLVYELTTPPRATVHSSTGPLRAF